ncbi:PLP-dependent transferase [Aspergillus ibericus CBS 121593]|uniref:PLP-dependent transferase n=1 Tax=Aspergillus ibericus CBS 121593 TaxID=1448316 RepID=A0A395H400_9EURO|nr:PLP-dependent transferase [Aspergillus ibericus CBS 121593]RAL02602.1 PLP-dependent transferase [Aspergillus ibericus CBS 121593]
MATSNPFFAKANKYLIHTGVPSSPVIITKAKGTRLYDSNSRQILDFTSGQRSACGSSLPPLEQSFFLNTGSESTEAAIKIAKTYTGKFEIVGFATSYHGLTQGSGSATYSAGRTGQILPLASASTTPEIVRGCTEAGFLWLTTHLNDPLTAAVGNKGLEIVERDHICQRAIERDTQLRQGLLKLQEKYWCIGDVRGRGLLQGIEIISDPETKTPGPDLGQAVSDRAMACGLSCNVVNLPGMGGMFRLAPPVTVSAEEIEGCAFWTRHLPMCLMLGHK